jgi:hypothetical protein
MSPFLKKIGIVRGAVPHTGIFCKIKVLFLQFFADVAKVLDVEIEFGRDGRPSGTACVLFGSQAEAKKALVKNRENMGSRYRYHFFKFFHCVIRG